MASVFTKIINGEIPGHFVYRDDRAIAIMTIAPIAAGHVLVIPIEEIDHWDDVPAPLAAHLMNVSQKVAKAIKKTFPCLRVGMVIAGLEVPHTHLHVLPINQLGDFDFSKAKMAEQSALAGQALLLKQALA
jgi:diadenosine tetraphosphate (Ap4A) HIT family hydrolase